MFSRYSNDEFSLNLGLFQQKLLNPTIPHFSQLTTFGIQAQTQTTNHEKTSNIVDSSRRNSCSLWSVHHLRNICSPIAFRLVKFGCQSKACPVESGGHALRRDIGVLEFDFNMGRHRNAPAGQAIPMHGGIHLHCDRGLD
jgi:hypothetical protein